MVFVFIHCLYSLSKQSSYNFWVQYKIDIVDDILNFIFNCEDLNLINTMPSILAFVV